MRAVTCLHRARSRQGWAALNPAPPEAPPAPPRAAVFIAICARLGLIRPAEWSTYDTDDVAAGLQNFLICIEMFLAAVAHAHAFPPRVRAPHPTPTPAVQHTRRACTRHHGPVGHRALVAQLVCCMLPTGLSARRAPAAQPAQPPTSPRCSSAWQQGHPLCCTTPTSSSLLATPGACRTTWMPAGRPQAS